MARRPNLRKLALTAHITSSVGWLGAVACFLALSVVGLTSDEAQTVRAAYLAMEAIGWLALAPLATASLLTGLIQGLGTKWGLFRHYWVVVKLGITVVATIVLLLYLQTLSDLGKAAAEAPSRDLIDLRAPSPVLHAAAALVLLLGATALSVYRPRGLTRYGWRKQQERTRATSFRS